MLGMINLGLNHYQLLNIVSGHHKIDWIIMGAESGKNRRSMKLEWAHSIAKQCINADIPMLYKQGPDDYGKGFIKMPMIYDRTWDLLPEVKK